MVRVCKGLFIPCSTGRSSAVCHVFTGLGGLTCYITHWSDHISYFHLLYLNCSTDKGHGLTSQRSLTTWNGTARREVLATKVATIDNPTNTPYLTNYINPASLYLLGIGCSTQTDNIRQNVKGGIPPSNRGTLWSVLTVKTEEATRFIITVQLWGEPLNLYGLHCKASDLTSRRGVSRGGCQRHYNKQANKRWHNSSHCLTRWFSSVSFRHLITGDKMSELKETMALYDAGLISASEAKQTLNFLYMGTDSLSFTTAIINALRTIK